MDEVSRWAKQAKGKNRLKGEWDEGLSALNRNAAGIDVGNAEHYVAVPAGRDPEPVQRFGSFTADLHDFFTAEVFTWRGPTTYYVLFLIQLETRRVTLAGMTQHPTEEWMQQVARNLTDADAGVVRGQRYLLHDRDTKFCDRFRSTLRAGGVEPLRLPASSPNFNAFAERWVRSVKEECLSKLILFGEVSLRRVLAEYLAYYHGERNHQGNGNVLLFPAQDGHGTRRNRVGCSKRLGGLLRYYSSAA